MGAVLTLTAAAFAAAAAVILVDKPDLLASRLGRRSSPIPVMPSRWIISLVAVTGIVLIFWPLVGPVGLLLGFVSLPVARYLQRRRARRARRDCTTEGVAAACVSMAADLSAGRTPHQALRLAATEWPELFIAAAGRAQIGGNVPAVLRQAAAQPGAGALTPVAAAWQISQHTGAGLADALLAVADSLRDEAAIRREAAAQLATLRVTARLLALLPVGTLGLFSLGNGGAPVRFLTRTGYGLACLAIAIVLVVVGLWWVERTSQQATRSVWN